MKFMTYCFWRAWILVAYMSPIWVYVTSEEVAPSCVFTMYAWSTAAFCVIMIPLCILRKGSARLLERRSFMCAIGVLASAGIVLEYLGASFFGAQSLLFIIGSIVTGCTTAIISLRAGQIYAATYLDNALTFTLLSELISGLIFFLIIGIIPQCALVIFALLPLLAALMTLFESKEEIVEVPQQHQDISFDLKARRKSTRTFLRFLAAVFVFTFVANVVRGMTSMEASDLVSSYNSVGIFLTVLVVFILLIMRMLFKSFRFGVIYYPLVLILVLAVLAAFALQTDVLLMGAIVTMSYCLFSMFIWGLFAFLVRSDYWSAIQVFGWGRFAFSLGAVLGFVIGYRFLPFNFLGPESLLLGIALAFLLVLCAMLVFRENDVDRIMNVASMEPESTSVHEVEEEKTLRDSSSDSTAEALPTEEKGLEEGTDGISKPPLDPIEAFASAHNLTAREREVFALMLQGRNARSIGKTLVISENTAKTHIRSIYAKTNVHTRQEFVEVTWHLISK